MRISSLNCSVILASAWLACLSPVAFGGENLIVNGDFSKGTQPWQLDRLEDARGILSAETAEDGKSAARVQVEEVAAVPFHIQLFQGKLGVEAGETYKLTFRAKGVPGAKIGLNLMVAEAPWTNLWKQDVELGPEWQEYSFDIRPSQSSNNARVTFTRLGAVAGEYWFTDVSLKR